MAQNELGNYLRLLRIKNNFTMTQTAERTGITQGYISQIENGIYTPSAKTLAKLARAYNVPEIHLLRKAGIVQLTSIPGTDDEAPMADVDPLVEISDANELVEQLKRGLSSLEYLSDQLGQRAQLANMPSEADILRTQEEMSPEMTLALYDSSWQPLANAAGEAAAMRIPAYMCADDTDAFILTVADDAMAPLIMRGDWVVISPAAELESGHVIALNDRNQIQLRSFMAANDVLSLMPLNPEYQSKGLIVDRSKDKVEIIGRVMRIVNREI
ncbi:LexA family transcriptional regulator [bacterium]|nr:LexA family transcriptional regulator [bacterium]